MPGREAPVNAKNFIVLRRYCQGTVLDIGSGNAHPHADVTLDVDPATDPDVVADLEGGIPAANGAYDTVTAVHVLEHVQDDVALWAEMQRVARRRAVAIVPIGPRDDPDHDHVYHPGDVDKRFAPDGKDTSAWGPHIDQLFFVDVDG